MLRFPGLPSPRGVDAPPSIELALQRLAFFIPLPAVYPNHEATLRGDRFLSLVPLAHGDQEGRLGRGGTS